MDRYHFECTYIFNVHIRVIGQEQLDYISFPFSSRPVQSSSIKFTLDIDVEVANLGLHLGKITIFDSCKECGFLSPPGI